MALWSVFDVIVVDMREECFCSDGRGDQLMPARQPADAAEMPNFCGSVAILNPAEKLRVLYTYSIKYRLSARLY